MQGNLGNVPNKLNFYRRDGLVVRVGMDRGKAGAVVKQGVKIVKMVITFVIQGCIPLVPRMVHVLNHCGVSFFEIHHGLLHLSNQRLTPLEAFLRKEAFLAKAIATKIGSNRLHRN